MSKLEGIPEGLMPVDSARIASIRPVDPERVARITPIERDVEESIQEPLISELDNSKGEPRFGKRKKELAKAALVEGVAVSEDVDQLEDKKSHKVKSSERKFGRNMSPMTKALGISALVGSLMLAGFAGGKVARYQTYGKYLRADDDKMTVMEIARDASWVIGKGFIFLGGGDE